MKAGGNLNAKDRKGGQTPLYLAAAAKHWDCVKYLLESGADSSIPCQVRKGGGGGGPGKNYVQGRVVKRSCKGKEVRHIPYLYVIIEKIKKKLTVHLLKVTYTVKKELAIFPSPAGMSLTKLSLGGKKLNYSRPGRV